MKSLSTLKREAQSATAFRGHRMHWFAPVSHGEGRYLQTGSCKRCDMTVHLNTRPAPNGIEIAGEAVALNCGDPS